MRLNKTFIFLVCLALMTSMAWGLSHQTGKVQSTNVSQILDTRTYLDKNKLLAFIYNDGNFCYDNANVLGKTDGLYFPRGSKKTVIYASGLWVGAKVDGTTRMAVAEFSSEFVPGPMANGTYQDDQASFRVYKINRGDDANNNSDYANWPANQGAPVDDLGNPALLGDQMCWTVFNDADPAKHRNTAASTAPLGVEIQESAFAFGRSGALGQVIFLKFLIINKGGNTLEDTYVSLWCDPDLGGASDDLVGCDTSLSLGYCYNDAGSDNTYGTAPPAVGFDFFQGPIVESDNPNDSAKFRGEWIQGYRNLPMTSFNRYINGTDPHSYSESYNYMQGLEPTGEPLVDNNGDTTTYFFAGDPVTGTGWLDGNSADRRFMMSSGPFTMEPDDTQEVVAAICVGQGANRLSSITALRTVDLQAQTVFDQNFDIPSPPPTPTVYTRGYDGKIDLVWTDSSINYVQDYRASLGQFYCFEGYNIYQAESPTGPWTRVATYDYEPSVMQRVFEDTVGANIVVCNEDSTSCDTIARPWDFTKIYQDVANPAKGGSERIIQQAGTNSGLVHHLSFSTSFLDGGPIINNRPYYFAVAPYAVDVDKVTSEDSFFVGQNFEGFISEPLENVLVPVTAIGKSSGAVFIDTAQHVSGPSQGMAIVEYLNYTDTTADDYEVVFDTTETDGSVVWDLKKNGAVVLEDQSNQGGGYDYEIYNGLMVRVMGPDPDIAPPADASNGGVIETATADGTIDPDNVFWSWNSTGEYYVSSDVPGSGY
ncbi:MAG: hypothetical protein GF404_06040, partial [candidate division Zixibacteria bacterium]|nr:hypothetical protein [candidate division Zixibacteria bacterium]